MARMAEARGAKPQRKRRSFTDEFKAGAVGLVLDSGKTIAEVARDLDLTASALGGWVERARADRMKGRTGLTTEERAELARLRKEVKDLKAERDLLKNHPAPGCSLFPRNSSSRTVRPSREERPSAFWCLEPDKKHGPGVAAGLPLVTLCDPV
jgi:transposase